VDICPGIARNLRQLEDAARQVHAHMVWILEALEFESGSSDITDLTDITSSFPSAAAVPSDAREPVALLDVVMEAGSDASAPAPTRGRKCPGGHELKPSKRSKVGKCSE
jgi:hypothetical protein